VRSQATEPAEVQTSAPAEKSTGPLPSLDLPKGGGAIRGIGEKFGVNPATGAGSTTVPLPSSPGRAGFGPELSIAYDSGSGNGLFGFGWTLSLPSITRKTDKGLPRYLDLGESDVFLISGAEDLVPILDDAGKIISLPRAVHKVDYTIRPYRPRIEGLFTRIERWTEVSTGISHWRTITKDNVTTIFGLDEKCRIADPQDAQRVFSYLIQLTYDDKGNATEYEYWQEDSAGINTAAANEANRSVKSRGSQRYLKYIRYGNATPYFTDWSAGGDPVALPAQWHFQVVFDYGDHAPDAPAPAKDRPWTLRPDPFSHYRGGFEVGTYRRVRRVLLFHNFPDEATCGADCLVRSTDFVYSDETTPADPRNPIYTFLESSTQTGYRRAGAGYQRSSVPPLEFFYSQPEVQPDVFTLTDDDSRSNAPEGLDGSRFQFVDLNGDGLSGILRDDDGSWSYKRNLSPLNTTLVNGEQLSRAQFGPVESVATLPVPGRLGSGQQFLDITGDGRLDLAMLDAPLPGYFERTSDDDWQPLKAFRVLPRINWSEPNLRFVDLTGDGLADVLITEDDVFTFYPSLGADGFGEAERVIAAIDEEQGPHVVFADGTQTVSLADMSGDGLRDMVRVRNGDVCYWPNLGYGHFGAKVALDCAPRFTDEESFDARRVRLADIDGSGTTDLIYVGPDGVQVCFNRSGNSFAAPHRLAVFPGADDLSSVQVMDLLGNGTACLVWSSPLPGEVNRPLLYVDLMGSQKPHLMVRTRNNLGAETRLSYAPSTRFYLEDERAGRPWVTKLPFPVHVVERVETYDWVGRSRFVSRYAYHHGYFDGYEREFRGFGMMEQRDTDEHRDDTLFPDVETSNEDAASFNPPILTRKWIHTGAFVEAGIVSQQYREEYWAEQAMSAADREALLIPDTVLNPDLTPDEMREAYRALKGSILRIEVYAEDGTAAAQNPYTVTEQNFTVTLVQPFGPNRHSVFRTNAREAATYQYERAANDPRVTHECTLEIDEFGNVLRSVSVGYPRRTGYPEPAPDLTPAYRAMLQHDQTRLHISATGHQYTKQLNAPEDKTLFDSYRAPMAAETITAELTGATPAGPIFRFKELDDLYKSLWTGAHDIPYENIDPADVDGAGPAPVLSRRIVKCSRTLYRSNDMASLLPLLTAESLALPGATYRLAFTTSLITRIYGNRVTASTFTEGGYVQLAGQSDWWIPSPRIFFSQGDADTPPQEVAAAQAHFFQPRRVIDPFGAISRVDYDVYDLLPSTATDAVGNVSMVLNDYRVLHPHRLIDSNQNFSDVSFDNLGQVVGTAVAGKAGEGDSLIGFVPDLTDAQIAAIRANPLNNPSAILGNATTRVVYDLFAYFRTRDLPVPDAPLVYTLTRETHVSDLAGGQTKYHHELAYSDGFGREAQRKVQAEPGPDGARWTGSGWTIFNNKGKPVRQYEPFFSATHLFEFNRLAGVSTVLLYDSVDRVVATLHPDQRFEKTIFNAWRQEIWDSNDTVLIADPSADADVGDFFKRLLGAAPFVSWHDLRIGGTFGATPDENAANQDAAQKASTHAATPTVIHFDSLGRACVSVDNNGGADRFARRTARDPDKKPLAIIDPSGRRVMEYFLRDPGYAAGYDLVGNGIYWNGIDGGERRSLSDISGLPIRVWNARGFVFRMKYDALRRPTHRYVSGGASEILLERTIYGDKHSDLSINLKGRLFRHYDTSGVSITDRCDFKGNILATTRQLAVDYRKTPNWAPIDVIVDQPNLNIAAIDAATSALLEKEAFASATRFDAMNRPIQVITPHSAAGKASVFQPIYNEAKLLEKVDVWIRQPAVPVALLNSATADLPAITNIDYNARGQRIRSDFGNGATTTYAYDDQTFRLINLTTTRPNADPNAQTVQALDYTYDPAGNITRIRDSADIHDVVFFRNQRMDPTADYTYDATYRLTRATGREHLGQNAPQQIGNDDSFRTSELSPGDGTAMGWYTEQYVYDPVGNILQMIHQAAAGAWTRRYSYTEPSRITATEMSNRLSATRAPGDNPAGPYSDAYSHDEHGNITKMPHLPSMIWDEQDRLRSTSRQVVNAGIPETTYYAYDSRGERRRKVTERRGIATRSAERIYFGALELYREYQADGTTVSLERETLHVMDDQKRIAIVETRTAGNDLAPLQLVRYQFANHLESSFLELDSGADVISYEEYFPYGSTSYRGVRNVSETPKRYRYTGKERDEENALYYCGARYYAPWLGRWTSTDPAGFVDSLSLYVYVSSNPVNFHDPKGTDKKKGAAPKPKPTFGGISFSPESQISAQQMFDMIQKNDKLAPWMKAMFAVKDNKIVLTSPNIPLPQGVDPADIPEWFKSALVAIKESEWHVTTGVSIVSSTSKHVSDKLLPDAEGTDLPIGMAFTTPGSIILGETVSAESKEPQSMGSRHMSDSSAGGSRTAPNLRRPVHGTTPAEGLITIANRFRDTAAPGIDVMREDNNMVETFFHEVAAHGGVTTQGMWDQSTHGPDPAHATLADDHAEAIHKFFMPPSEQDRIDFAQQIGPTGVKKMQAEFEQVKKDIAQVQVLLQQLQQQTQAAARHRNR
jgi:RHS repeat-associated protein